MARNKPARHKRRAKATVTPLTWALDHDAVRILKLPPHQSFARFRDGTADEGDWHTIVARLNLASYITERIQIAERDEIRAEARKALDGMVATRERHGRTGRWGMTGDELRQVGDLLTVVDDLQDVCTRRELYEAVTAMYAANDRAQRRAA